MIWDHLLKKWIIVLLFGHIISLIADSCFKCCKTFSILIKPFIILSVHVHLPTQNNIVDTSKLLMIIIYQTIHVKVFMIT